MVRPPRFNRGRPLHRAGRRFGWLWPLLWLAVFALAWQAWNDPAVRRAIGLPLPQQEQVALRFPLCADPGFAANCVVDGDTFTLGRRKVRVAGIDAPELRGACPAETAAAARATRALQGWLNAGPFLLEAAATVPHDQYGRELQQPIRGDDALADHLIRTGHAREYRSGRRQGWC
jgi:endonuclease YncB( thermonuclease family)